MVSMEDALKPVRSIGGFYAMALDTLVAMVTRPLAWREFLLQTWFIARVSLVPTLLLTIPFTVLIVFTLNVLLHRIRRRRLLRCRRRHRHRHPDRSDGDGPGRRRDGCHRDVRRPGRPNHPRGTRRHASAGCRPDPGAWSCPGCWRPPSWRRPLVSLVSVVGLTGGFVFSVFVQHVTPGAFAAGLTLCARFRVDPRCSSRERCSAWRPR